jgi:hypothetical protein
MIAESICCWLYSRLPVMKAHSFIVRALLFAVVLAPAAMRLPATSPGALSYRVARPQLPASHAEGPTLRTLDQFVTSMQRHRAPAARLHRIRGKKISTQAAPGLTPRCCTQTEILISDAHVGQHDSDGPNPSRGPPSQICL